MSDPHSLIEKMANGGKIGLTYRVLMMVFALGISYASYNITATLVDVRSQMVSLNKEVSALSATVIKNGTAIEYNERTTEALDDRVKYLERMRGSN